MKNFTAILLILMFILSGAGLAPTQLQAQDSPTFHPGSVYVVTLTKTKANSQAEYLRLLGSYFLPRLERWQEEGLILSYKVLTGADANPDDFNMMVLVEYKNMAAMDPSEENRAKRQAIQQEMIEKLGGQEAFQAIVGKYPEVRTIFGRKLMREQILE